MYFFTFMLENYQLRRYIRNFTQNIIITKLTIKDYYQSYKKVPKSYIINLIFYRKIF